MDTSSENRESLPFNPSGPAEWLMETFNDTPRYLFHVSAPKSEGETSSSWAKSKDALAARASSTRDIFGRSPNYVANMLSKHLERKRNLKFDNFVSWTSSLLFALQYMFYRHQEDRSPLESISLYIVDTTLFPKGVFVRDMDLVSVYTPSHEELANLERVRGGRNDTQSGYTDPLRYMYFGEYLSQGALRIEGKYGVVSAQKMIDHGLFSVRPEFKASKRFNLGLESRVVQLRKIFDSHSFEHRELEKEIHAAISIADLFGSVWRAPMAVALMGLRPSARPDVAVICQKLADAFPGTSSAYDTEILGIQLTLYLLELTHYDYPVPTKEQPFKRLLPEVRHFEAIMTELSKYVTIPV